MRSVAIPVLDLLQKQIHCVVLIRCAALRSRIVSLCQCSFRRHNSISLRWMLILVLQANVCLLIFSIEGDVANIEALFVLFLWCSSVPFLRHYLHIVMDAWVVSDGKQSAVNTPFCAFLERRILINKNHLELIDCGALRANESH